MVFLFELVSSIQIRTSLTPGNKKKFVTWLAPIHFSQKRPRKKSQLRRRRLSGGPSTESKTSKSIDLMTQQKRPCSRRPEKWTKDSSVDRTSSSSQVYLIFHYLPKDMVTIKKWMRKVLRTKKGQERKVGLVGTGFSASLRPRARPPSQSV